MRAEHFAEPLKVGQVPQVERERPLVDVAVKVVFVHLDVGAVKAALEQAPEVLQAVRRNAATDVLDAVVDDVVVVLTGQRGVRLRCVRVER